MTEFDKWWDNEARHSIPRKGENHAEHMRRIAEIAWDTGAFVALRDKTRDVWNKNYAEAVGIPTKGNWASKVSVTE